MTTGFFTPSEVATNVRPAGDYEIRIDKVEAGISKSSDAPMLSFEAAIVSGPPGQKGKLFWRRSLMETALGMISDDMLRMGIIGRGEQVPRDAESLAEYIRDRAMTEVYAIKITVKTDKNGDLQNNIRFLRGQVASSGYQA